ncbi:MAG: hypothetical protein ACE5Q6_18370 [Dehalococcoidia bacterium]
MTNSRADNHDIDKLGRWLGDLTGQSSAVFPVYAVFLVSEVDQAAHDIFRQYRTSFEERGAGFANLIIFGQHGVSTTVRHLLAEWGLPEQALPSLVLIAGDREDTGYAVNLPGGVSSKVEGSAPPRWQEILRWIEASVETPGREPELAAPWAANSFNTGSESLDQLVRQALQALKPEG